MANGLAMAIWDAFPVSPGHTLIMPKRHVTRFFDTTTEERLAMFELLDKVKRELSSSPLAGEDRGGGSGAQPAAYNIGVNDGALAGQTIMHVHVHLIPRYPGDDSDPRGGVRRIFPKKAKYWK